MQLLGNRLSDGNALAEDNVRFSDRVQKLGENIAGLVAATGEIIIYTPQTVLTRPDQILTAPAEVVKGAIERSKNQSSSQGAGAAEIVEGGS